MLRAKVPGVGSPAAFRRHLAIILDGKIAYAPTINQAIRTDGQISGSGFTKDEETSVLGAYSGARVTSRTDEGEWVCVSLQR